jgi:hypothetical protein
MGDLVEMPKRCAYLGCRKAIRYDKGHTSIEREGKHYHKGCFDKMSDPDPPSGGGQAVRGFRRRMSAYENGRQARAA